uniref:RNase H type-1 domain-containing protein n=1 Tax=Peronospora matthiolae TaxID=2874970 RepID=A0AAV1TKF6_9STRA
MAYSEKMTANNLAEHRGLVHGLRQAKVSAFVPLHVLSGSAIVVSQLRMNRPLLKPQLAALYREARALADEVAVAVWFHQYREYNEMVDRAAKIAVDTLASAHVLTPPSRHLVFSVEEVMDEDVNH